MRPSTRVALWASFAIAAAPASGRAQGALLKDIQRSIRERILTEAGATDLIFTKVDFSHCAATIQTRTLKQTGREVRLTTTFHITSLNPAPEVSTIDSYSVVQLTSSGAGGSGLRQLEQVIDSGKIRETARPITAFELRFQRPATAAVVQKGFGRMVAICESEDPATLRQ